MGGSKSAMTPVKLNAGRIEEWGSKFLLETIIVHQGIISNEKFFND